MDLCENEDRVAAGAALLLQLCRDGGMWVTPDHRISLDDAARLVGLTKGHMKNIISEGRGPQTYGIGFRGSRVTVSLVDLAKWRESRRR